MPSRQSQSRVLSLAGFQVTIIGRFWVTAEVVNDKELMLTPSHEPHRCLLGT
jgi:hypothetical protein